MLNAIFTLEAAQVTICVAPLNISLLQLRVRKGKGRVILTVVRLYDRDYCR